MAATYSGVYKFLATFVDDEGEESTVIGWYPVAAHTVAEVKTALDTWVGKLKDLSVATLRSYGFQLDAINDLGLPAVSGSMPNIEDKAFIVFQSASTGQPYKTNIPAPKSTNFGTDGETIKWTDVNVSAYTTWVEANLVTNAGGTTLTKIKGYFRRAKTRRKVRQGIPSEMGG